jgi:hypothetical protein
LFRLSKVLLHLRKNFCFFGLQEFFVQFLFGSANLEVKSVNASVRDSMPSIFSTLAIVKANMKYLALPTHLPAIGTSAQL